MTEWSRESGPEQSGEAGGAKPPFDLLVTRFGGRILRLCRAALDPDAAEDVWSETFLAALRGYPGLDSAADVEGWLVTIARRKVIDALRTERRRTRRFSLLDDEGGTGMGALAKGQGTARSGWLEVGHHSEDRRLREVQAALDALPPRQRATVTLRYLGELSHAEIAAAVGGTEAAARRAVFDGLASLRRRLGVEGHRRKAAEVRGK